MRDFVLDASVALAWLLPDEACAASVGALLDDAENITLVVPELWRLEIANILLTAEWTNRFRAQEIDFFIERLEALPVAVWRDDISSFGDVIQLGRKHRLTAYDASYLNLALRLGLPLATLDKPLRRAANAENIPDPLGLAA
ncbi:MAG: type II toxin-antitoxin system VapC family toxin [Alphaproteobacteria bacterium]